MTKSNRVSMMYRHQMGLGQVYCFDSLEPQAVFVRVGRRAIARTSVLIQAIA